jgi:hypothetical protein
MPVQLYVLNNYYIYQNLCYNQYNNLYENLFKFFLFIGIVSFILSE